MWRRKMVIVRDGEPVKMSRREKNRFEQRRLQRESFSHLYNLSFIEKVRMTTFPVYGPVEQPFGYTVCAHGMSGNLEQKHIGSISFTFAHPEHPIRQEALKITSSLAHEPHMLYPKHGEAMMPDHHRQEFLFRQYQILPEM